MENLESAYREVIEEFGKVLPLEIRVDAPSAYFDWRKVTIPKSFLKWSKENLQNVLRHEFGHLFFSPRDPDVSMVIYYIASVAGYSEPWRFVNIVTDLLVDMSNMEMFGENYLRFLEWSLHTNKRRCDIISVMEGVYRKKACNLGLNTTLKENDIGNMVYSILSDDKIDFYIRIARVASLLREPYNRCTMPKHFTIHIFAENINPVDIARVLIRNRIDPKIIAKIHGVGARVGFRGAFAVLDDPVIIEYNRMHAITKYLELKKDFGREERREKENAKWKVGDSVEALDVVSTLTNYGIILPGVFSLKHESKRVGDETGGKGYMDSIIILDCSSSMDGNKFERAREAAYVIARKTYEDGGKVGLIPFASDINEEYVIEPTKDFGMISDLILRLTPRGGTAIVPAIIRVGQMGKNYQIYAISDFEVFDEAIAKDLLKRIANRATFFYISEKESPEGRWFSINGVRIIAISPEGLVKKVYGMVRR